MKTLSVFYGVIPHIENAVKFRVEDNPPPAAVDDGLTDLDGVFLTDLSGTILTEGTP